MNIVIISGRLVADPDVRYSRGENPMTIARYRLAVDRPRKNGEEREADFINCTAFGAKGDFAEKYLSKGTKIIIRGRIRTDSYLNKDGQKVYTTEVIVDEHEFAQSAGGSSVGGSSTATKGQRTASAGSAADDDDFLSVGDSDVDELPFA